MGIIYIQRLMKKRWEMDILNTVYIDVEKGGRGVGLIQHFLVSCVAGCNEWICLTFLLHKSPSRQSSEYLGRKVEKGNIAFTYGARVLFFFSHALLRFFVRPKKGGRHQLLIGIPISYRINSSCSKIAGIAPIHPSHLPHKLSPNARTTMGMGFPISSSIHLLPPFPSLLRRPKLPVPSKLVENNSNRAESSKSRVCR